MISVQELSQKSFLNWIFILTAILLNYLHVDFFLAFLLLSMSTINSWAICLENRNRKIPLIAQGYFWVLTSLMVIFFLSPLVVLTNQDSIDSLFMVYDWKSNIPKALLMGIVAISSYANGFQKKRGPGNEETKYRKILNFPFLLFAIFLSITMFALYSRSVGGFGVTLSTRQNQSLNQVHAIYGYLRDAPLIAIGSLTAGLAILRNHGEELKWKIYSIYLCIAIFLLPYLSSGSRSVFIYVGLVLVIINVCSAQKTNTPIQLNSLKRRFTLIIMVSLIPALIIGPRLYRSELRFDPESIRKAYSVQEIAKTFTGQDTLMLVGFSILISKLDEKVIPREYGQSYLAGLGKPIPRALWKDKPTEFDMRMNQIIFPQIAKNYGVSFSALSEPLVNFGVVGILTFFWLLGFWTRGMSNSLDFENPKKIWLYAWSIGFLFILIRGNLSTDYHRVLFPVLASLPIFGSRKLR